MNENEQQPTEQPQEQEQEQPQQEALADITAEQQVEITHAIEVSERIMAWADEHVDKCADTIGEITALQTLGFAISLLSIVTEEFQLDLVCNLLLTRLAQIVKAGLAAGLSDDTVIFGKPDVEQVRAEVEASKGGES